MSLVLATVGQAQPTGLAGTALDVIEALGEVGLGLLVAAENLFPPTPSEVILPLAGFLAGQGRLSLPLAVLAATAGSLVGALALYGLGRAWGRERSRRVVGRLPFVDIVDLERAEARFDRHASASVLVGRCVPVVRSLISLPAGAQQMPLLRFCVLTTIGSAVWNTLFIGAGYVLGEQWERVGAYVNVLTYAVAAVLVALFVRAVVTRVRRHRRGEDDGSRSAA